MEFVPLIMTINPTPDGDYVVEVWETIGGLRTRLAHVTTITAEDAERYRRACPDDDSYGVLP